jgi:hypothetical protein
MDAHEGSYGALAEDYDSLQMEAAYVVAEWQRLTDDEKRAVQLRAPGLVRRIEQMRDNGRPEWWLDAIATDVGSDL